MRERRRTSKVSEGLFVGALILSAVFLIVSGTACAADDRQESVSTLTVTGFEFSGNDTISSDTLATVLRDVVGRELTLDDLLEQANRITRFYREQGFVVARAFLPNQEVVGGIVRIYVLEGRFGEIRLDNASRLRDEVALAHLASLETGDPIRKSNLERTTLLLNDLPGVQAETTFVPGEGVGTADLLVSLRDRSPWTVSLSVNNYDSEFRGQLGASWRNPRGYGDELTVGVGPWSGKHRSGNVLYTAPIGGNGLSASLSFATSNSRQTLASTPIVTTKSTTGGRLDYPVVRTQSRKAVIGLKFDVEAQQRTIGAFLVDESRISRTTFEWQGDRASDGNLLSYSLSVTRGTLTLAPESAAAADAASARTAGAFGRFNANAVLRWPVRAGWTLKLDVRGQLATKNLHSSEKMSAGGISGVRAYEEGAAKGDQGWLVRTQLERGFHRPDWRLAGKWIVFADIGGVQVNRFPWPGSGTDNKINLAGIGGGLTIARDRWSVEVINAYPIGFDRAEDCERRGRLWVRATWQF